MRVVVAALCTVAPFAAATDADWENLRTLRSGQQIEVVQMDLKSFSGRLLKMSDDGIRVLVKKDERVVARADVFRVGVRRGARRARNIGIGLGVGAALGAAAGRGLLAATEGSDAAGAVLGTTTIIGAGLGGGLGAIQAGYKTIYRSPKPVKPRTP
jgi:hypothetical protein